MQKRISFGIALSLFTACATDAPVVTTTAVDDEIARLESELATVPGELVIATASQRPFSIELESKLATTDKVIYVDSTDRVVAYIGYEQADVPEGVPVHRTFGRFHDDRTIADQRQLADYLVQEDADKTGVANANALKIGNGEQWPESTIAFTLNANLSASERALVLDAVKVWNETLDPVGNQGAVRFVPRYAGDNRPFVDFVKGGIQTSTECGSSHVGRADNIFTNWFSHSINVGSNCFSMRTLHHHMAHTAGLGHEHQRCGRRDFVTAFSSAGPNCGEICDLGSGGLGTFGPYNYLSITHYPYSTAENLANDPDRCGLRPVESPKPFLSWRGNPFFGGTSVRLDAGDVEGLNQSYVNRRRLPPIGVGRVFTISPSYNSNLALQIPSTSNVYGVQLQLNARDGSKASQQFFFVDDGAGVVRIKSRFGPNLCVDDLASRTDNGAPVGIWDCVDVDSQRWILAPNAGNAGQFDLINKFSGKSIDVTNASMAPGTPIQQWDHLNNAQQRFTLTSLN